jgi:hypothetical protein
MRASYVLAAGALASAALSPAAPTGPSVDVKVSRRGFAPARITLRRGETARLVLTSDDGEHCFAIDALRIEKRVTRDRPTRLELTGLAASRSTAAWRWKRQLGARASSRSLPWALPVTTTLVEISVKGSSDLDGLNLRALLQVRAELGQP